MNFRNFIKETNLNAVRNVKTYVVEKNPNGGFKLIPNNNVAGVAKIINGVLNLPTELEPHRDEILNAYFSRYPGMHNTGNTTGSHIDANPKTFAFKPTAKFDSDIFGSPS